MSFDAALYAMLKNKMGGGSGGSSGLPTGSAPHQYLTTDKDGNAVWEEKLCYKVDGRKEIAPETQFDSTNGGCYVTLSEALVEGEEYIVVYNGTEYPCVATLNNEVNHLTLGGVNDGYPFWLDYFDESNELWINASDTAFAISIYKNGAYVKKIDPKYLPDIGATVVTLTPVDEMGEEFTADKTFAELQEACDQGATVCAMIDLTKLFPAPPMLLPLVSFFHDEFMQFSLHMPSNGGGSMFYNVYIGADNFVEVLPTVADSLSMFYVEVDTTKKGYVYSTDDFDFLADNLVTGCYPVASFHRSVEGYEREQIKAYMTAVKQNDKYQFVQMTFTTIVDGNKLITLTYDKDSPNNELTYEEVEIGGSLPSGIVTASTPGTAGQFAVSDGAGGITWKTIVEAEEVSY